MNVYATLATTRPADNRNPHVTIERTRESLMRRARAHECCARHFRSAAKQLQVSKWLISERN